MNLDDLDRRLLDRIQRNFPIEPRPFEVLAHELGTDEATVIDRVCELQSGGVVRQIGPVFDLHRLGYSSTLCAAKVDVDAVDAVADHINAYPEVTHNYLRDAQFNMWFTLVAPSQERIEVILEEIRHVAGIYEVISLPADRTFKIDVHFTTANQDPNSNPLPSKSSQMSQSSQMSHTAFTASDIALIRVLQAPLPIAERPYLEIARQTGMSEDEVIARVRGWLDSGVIRRFGARVKHHAIGYTANGMCVLDVPPEKVETAGRYIASLPQVSHCYTRPRLPQWPYNLYAMIHSTKEEDVRAVAATITAHLNITDYNVLFSTRELKKFTPIYF